LFTSYSPEELGVLFEGSGVEHVQGSVGGARNHEFIKFYPLIYTTDHYKAYAQGIWVIADLIANKRSIVRVELDMDLVYDEAASVTRIRGASAWRQPVLIGWSRVQAGLGELKAEYDLTPPVGDTRWTSRSFSPRQVTPVDRPEHGIEAVFKSELVQRDGKRIAATLPAPLRRKIEQAFDARIVTADIVLELNEQKTSVANANPFVEGQCGIGFDATQKASPQSSFRVLLLGADEQQVYAIVSMFVTQPGARRSAIVTAELNLPLSSDGDPGDVHWSGPFIGDWQCILGFNRHEITTEIHP
jgi:hypothetical protein